MDRLSTPPLRLTSLPGMLFQFLNFFTPLLYPIGLIWLGCLVAAGVFAWKKQKPPAISLTVVAVVISIIGSDLSGALLRTLEKPYARETLAEVPVCDAVVVLGGGIAPSKYDPAGFTFTDAGDRIIAAVEVLRLGKAPVLVLGGGFYETDGEKESDAPQVQDWLVRSGLVTNQIVQVGITHNTREEAVKVKALAGEHEWKRVILVTSAFHMKRTEAVFRTAGLDVIPVACDFNTVGRPKGGRTFNPFPKPEGFGALNYYIHEQVGMLIYRLRGWIAEPPSTAAGE